MVGLLRMHCLLTDYRLALKTIDDIDLSKKACWHFADFSCRLHLKAMASTRASAHSCCSL